MKNIMLVTQGCDKNTVDTEYLAGALAARGMRPLSPATWDGEAVLDAIVINTCGFIDDAKQQSIDTILAWAEHREEQGGHPRLIVAGCLSQLLHAQLAEELPEVDAFVGVGAWDQIAGLLARRDHGEPSPIPEPDMRIDSRLARLPLDSEPHRFLKISDGCNQQCTFCSIPLMKGRHRSVPLEILVDEARGLIESGAREINLIAQDLTSYGIDLLSRIQLADLIEALDAIEGDFWLRPLYAYPSRMDDRLIETLAGGRHVIPYLDMPLQHASDPVLRTMRRPGGQAEIESLLSRLRAAIPGLVLRTTFIVGFPGETDRDFETLLDFLRNQRFERVGAFVYQPQGGTPSAEMKCQVPEEIRAERHHALMMTQQGIAEVIQRERFLGRRLRVLVEAHDEETGLWRSRSHADAPGVDGITWIEAGRDDLRPGDRCEVDVVDTDPYDMRSELVGKLA
ncbi:30S ribosomal protein S12 methylthiotransferase RimO [Candidatus Sumerlaeota bacterium]|nr:30S ribosomal protein S12 methylthiotransferase RimO [Candidatus Sumerlaeota bacterium]